MLYHCPGKTFFQGKWVISTRKRKDKIRLTAISVHVSYHHKHVRYTAAGAENRKSADEARESETTAICALTRWLVFSSYLLRNNDCL